MKALRYMVALLMLLFLNPNLSLAQFDEEAESESQSPAKQSVDKDLDEDKSDATGETFDEEDRKSISRDDIKSLEGAVRTKSETAMLSAVSQILSQDSGNLEALNAMGLFYFDMKKYGMAKILFKRALKSHPNQAALHNNLGITYLAEGDLPLALDAFKKSLSGDSNNKTASTNLGSIYIKYGDYERGLEPLANSYRAMRSDLGRGSQAALEVANNYAVGLIGVGEHSKASKVFEEIDDGNFKNPQVYLNYATFLVEVRKKKKDAIRVISKLKFMTEDILILKRVSELERKLE